MILDQDADPDTTEMYLAVGFALNYHRRLSPLGKAKPNVQKTRKPPPRKHLLGKHLPRKHPLGKQGKHLPRKCLPQWKRPEKNNGRRHD
jgi:hypothetical protein